MPDNNIDDIKAPNKTAKEVKMATRYLWQDAITELDKALLLDAYVCLILNQRKKSS